mmetsp:Transcript_51571/g.148771  ORF Transcript_51571/g.148771 Transcript_51571/m.148771 type:complete len:182 (+) Transcript_51571:122-667(+)
MSCAGRRRCFQSQVAAEAGSRVQLRVQSLRATEAQLKPASKSKTDSARAGQGRLERAEAAISSPAAAIPRHGYSELQRQGRAGTLADSPSLARAGARWRALRLRPIGSGACSAMAVGDLGNPPRDAKCAGKLPLGAAPTLSMAAAWGPSGRRVAGHGAWRQSRTLLLIDPGMPAARCDFAN